MDESDIVSRLSALEQRVKSLEEVTSSVTKLLQQVAVIDTKLNAISDQIEKFSNRLTEIERQPADKWGMVVKTLITVGLTAVATYAVSRFIP